jgi:hypothetical protein
MDEWVMLRYLSWIHIGLSRRPFALVLDSFSGHATSRILHKAKFLGIELIPVPKGMTGEYQPLDRSCFGPLKMMSQKAWSDRVGARLPEEVWRG